ncbi:MAG: hypothetical protein EA411_00010 [Saprospirales bacterium]|nr:MAG: hypothetical protein EA411_00010 [Saprospirales bacterium]
MDFGHPRINFATFDVKSPTEYILTLPLVKDDRISAFIFYYANSDHGYFTFAPLSIGMELLSQDVNQSFDQDPIMTLIKYNNYLYTRYSSYSESINNWLKEYINFHNQIDEASERNTTIKVYFTTVTFPEEYIEEINHYNYFNVTFVCPTVSEINWGVLPPGSPGDGEGSPGGGAGQNTNVPGDKPFETLNPIEIDEDCSDYQFTEEALMELEKLSGGDFYSCNAEEISTEEIIENILAALCTASGAPNQTLGTGDISNVIGESIIVEYIHNALAEEEYVMTSGLGANCPKAKCLIDMLSGEEVTDIQTPLLCDLLSGFLGEDRHLYFATPNFNEEENMNNQAHAATIVYPDDFDGSLQVLINFNSSTCEDHSTFDLFHIFLHELIHADIKRQLIEDYGIESPSSKSHQEAFNELLKEMNYDTLGWTNEHQLMLEDYLSGMVDALMAANGGIGERGHYLQYLLNGFGADPDIVFEYARNEWPDEEFEDIDEVKAFIQSGINFFNDLENIHENFEICDD